MQTRIEVELDDQNRLVLPEQVVEQATTDVAYLRVQQPQPPLVEEEGVLIITSLAEEQVHDVLQADREQRLNVIWWQE
jgi:hypothetical protein